MCSFFKQHFYKFTSALLLLLLLFFPGSMPTGSADFADNELIILWEDSISPEESARRLSVLCPELVLLEHIADFSLCQGASPAYIKKQIPVLNADPSVRIVERNLSTDLYGTLSDVEYSDAQWAFHNTGDYTYYINGIPIRRSSVADIDINLPEAYDILASGTANRSVLVAVIDTGIDITHPALREHIWINEREIPMNGIDDDGNGYVDDIYGWDFYNNDNSVCHYTFSDLGQVSAHPDDDDNHGTHCAGIIAATEGVFGVAGGIDIRILPLKIHGGAKNSGSIANAIKAVKYAQAAGADICNMSWGTPVYSEALETVMRESDMLFVVAAGNAGSNNNSSPLYPASFSLDNMISVAYITQSGTLATDSNYGISTVDIAAPGQDIYSTTVGGGYHYRSGTSMAAPVVSGVSALLYSCGDSLYPQNVKEILLQTLKPLDSLTGYVRYPGIPDAAKALQAADLLSPDTVAPTVSAATQYQEASLAVLTTTEDLGGSGIRTIRYAAGKRDLSYFCKGTAGQAISDSVLHLNRPGTYTFYISDYAGNETVFTYTVEDDTRPPVLSASCKENADGTFTVTVTAEDTGSGIKRLRYLEGEHPVNHFLSAGNELPPESLCTFIAAEQSVYTIYAADYRGNKTTYTLDVKKSPANQLILNTTERTLRVGDSFRLYPLMLPLTSTNFISYAVNDETLLYIAEDGTLTALAPGTAIVTVTTSGGISKTCTIHIPARF